MTCLDWNNVQKKGLGALLLALAWVIALLLVLTMAVPARATENGGSVWPVGAESYATAAGVPHAGETLFYEYSIFYWANELTDGKGRDAGVPDFNLRVFGMAGKLAHNWGVHVLGGELGSNLAVPSLYERVSVAGDTSTKDDLSNINLVPITIYNHKGWVHWYYELQVETLASGYQAGAPLNIGEHNMALTPGAAFTLTPRHNAEDIMSRFDYVINGVDHATHYHSGNEFFWQFDAQQEVAHHASIGVNGYFYKQVTNDTANRAPVVTVNADGSQSVGYKGRELDLGPQVTLPLGHHGAMVFKWDHDMLVQNKPRGNALWFELGVPFSYLHHVGKE